MFRCIIPVLRESSLFALEKSCNSTAILTPAQTCNPHLFFSSLRKQAVAFRLYTAKQTFGALLLILYYRHTG